MTWEAHFCATDGLIGIEDGRLLLGDPGLQVIEAYMVDNDCWAIGRKG